MQGNKLEFLIKFEQILREMEKKNPTVFRRNIYFLSSEPMDNILPVLKRFFPTEQALIDLFNRRDIDTLLERMIGVDAMKIGNAMTGILRDGKAMIFNYGFFPPVELFFTFNGTELYEAMVERIYKDLKKAACPVSLSKIWARISRTFGNNPTSARYFSKELLFKVRQRLKNYLEKDERFALRQISPKKIELRLAEWEHNAAPAGRLDFDPDPDPESDPDEVSP